jgi:hypothetical protein
MAGIIFMSFACMGLAGGAGRGLPLLRAMAPDGISSVRRASGVWPDDASPRPAWNSRPIAAENVPARAEPPSRQTRKEPANQPSAMEAVRPVLEAIWEVETGQGQDLRRGDGGLAAGHLQQHAAHWRRGCQELNVRWPWPGKAAVRRDSATVERAFRVALANWTLDAKPLIDEARRRGLNERVVAGLARAFRLPNDLHRRDNEAYARRVVAAWKDQ